LPGRLSFGMTVIPLPGAITGGYPRAKVASSSPPARVYPGLLWPGRVIDETYRNYAIIYHPGRAVEIADLFHCK